MREILIKSLKSVGLQLKKYPDYEVRRRLKIMKSHNIDTLFDIGANSGQYALEMRNFGYKGKIISFEPLKDAFHILQKSSFNDPNWIVNNYALGERNYKSFINVSSNSTSSSIKSMLPRSVESAPKSKYINQQEIEIKTLDSISNSFCDLKNNIMVKIDTQGFEKNVLEGGEKFFQISKIIQLEMSLVTLYDNQMLFVEMINYVNNLGFELYSLENGFADNDNGQLLQVDGIFVKI